MSMLPPADVLHLDNCDVWKDDEGFVRVLFKPCPRHGLAEAKAIVDAHNRLSDGRKCGVLADLSGITTGADREARNHYVSDEGSRLKLGMAMLTPKPLERMLGNVFFRMNRPPYPCRMFQTEPEAVAWLKTLQTAE